MATLTTHIETTRLRQLVLRSEELLELLVDAKKLPSEALEPKGTVPELWYHPRGGLTVTWTARSSADFTEEL